MYRYGNTRRYCEVLQERLLEKNRHLAGAERVGTGSTCRIHVLAICQPLSVLRIFESEAEVLGIEAREYHADDENKELCITYFNCSKGDVFKILTTAVNCTVQNIHELSFFYREKSKNTDPECVIGFYDKINGLHWAVNREVPEPSMFMNARQKLQLQILQRILYYRGLNSLQLEFD